MATSQRFPVIAKLPEKPSFPETLFVNACSCYALKRGMNMGSSYAHNSSFAALAPPLAF